MTRYSSCNIISIFNIPRIILVSILSVMVLEGYSQNAPAKPSRQSALEAFSEGNFELAYNHFSALSVQYPKDPLYKYYRGVCLVNLKRDPSLASALLNEAIKGSLAVRSVPSDALFYLGRSEQMEGKYYDAIESFTKFTGQEGKRVARQMDVPGFISQCEDGKGKIDEQKSISQQVAVRDNENKSQTETKNLPEAKETVKPGNNKPGKELMAGDYEKLLAKALELRFRSDSLSRLAERKRSNINQAANNSRPALMAEIQNLDKLSSSYREEADKLMAKAQLLINKPEGPGIDTVKILTSVRKSAVASDSLKTEPGNTKRDIKQDSVAVVRAEVQNKEVSPKSDVAGRTTSVTGVAKEKQAAKINKPAEQVFAVFAINKKQVFKPGDKIQINPDVPSGLVYRIQVAVFRNPISPSYFKGITPVYGFRAEKATVTNYYAGMFRRYNDASKALNQVKSLGFKDAFIAATVDRKPVSKDRAGILEKEWGSKSLINKTDQPQDTIPPTLVYRIEIQRSQKPLPDDQVENMKKLGESHMFDIIENDSNQYIYLIGKFITFKSASEYADLLIRNGFREARVVAYLGTREIPMETARQLFGEN
jgi:tetratricopeptide (TPR) repeat protein